MAGEQHGLVRSEHVRRGLAESPQFINTMQHQHNISNRQLKTVLPLTDLLGIKREELGRTLMSALEESLLKRVCGLSSAVLSELLFKVLPFINVEPLQPVVMQILKQHPDPPPAVLKQLRLLDKNVIAALPRHTRQRMWERHQDTFEQHVTPLIHAYCNDYAVMSASCEMHPVRLSVPRKRRSRQKALQAVVGCVGSSVILYRCVVSIIRNTFQQNKHPLLCSLRADLLMSLHDTGVHEITKADPCHQLAWYLDAYAKQLWIKMASGPVALKEAIRGLAEITRELKKIESGASMELIANPRQSSNVVMHKAQHQQKTLTVGKVLMDCIKKIKREDKQRLFHRPVVEAWPALAHSYPQKIKTPMDLGTIQSRIERDMYVNFEEVVKDINLISQNAMEFNGASSEISNTANKLVAKAKSILASAEKKLNAAKEEARQRKHIKNKLDIEQEEHDRRVELLRQQQLKEQKQQQKQSLSDASMLLSAGFTINALCCVLCLAIDEDVLKQEALPREKQVVKDLMWLLQVGDNVHSLLADPNAMLPTLDTTLERTALPLFSQMKLDGIEYRRNKHDTTIDLPPVSSSLLSMLEEHKCCVNVFIYVVCERVRKRDLVAAMDWLKVLCSDVLCRQDVFLHSLCTAFHFSAIAPSPVSNVVGRKKVHINMHPQLPVSLRVDVIKMLYLPNIYHQTKKGEDHLEDIALAHAHLIRFLTLDSSVKIFQKRDFFNYCKSSLGSLSLQETSEDNAEDNLTQHNTTICRLYIDRRFKRARRYYDKLFTLFPTLRQELHMKTNTQLEMLFGVVSSQNTPGNTPAPTPSPSPMPTPTNDSPFPGMSPMVEQRKTPLPVEGEEKEGNKVLAKLMPFNEADEPRLKKSKTE